MAVGFPVKNNYVTGDVLTANNMNDLSGTLNTLSGISGSNPVLNSAFQIWQRGTSPTYTHNNTTNYQCDRWLGFSVAAGRTVTRQVTNDTTNLPFIQFCARVQRTAANTSTNGIELWQIMESINSIPYAGKTVTLSFYARAGANFSAASNQLTAILYSGTGTDQNPVFPGYTGSAQPVSTTAILTTTWQRFTVSGTIATTATELSLQFAFGPVGTAGAADFFEVTGVQLEVGSVATPFKTYAGTIQGELAACQRYYYRQTPSTSFGWMASGIASGTTGGAVATTFPVQMRTTPSAIEFATVAVSDASGSTAVTALTIDTSVSSANVGVCNFGVASGLTAFRFYYLRQNNNATAHLAFTAEL